MTDAVLRAAVDRVIPADAWSGTWDGGVGRYLAVAGADLDWARPLLDALTVRLGTGFAALPPVEQDAALRAVAAHPDGAAEFAALRRICWEGYYASSPGVVPLGLPMVGFTAVPPGVTPVESSVPPGVDASAVRNRYDAVVVGSGPGGGVAAQVLAQAGKQVLVLERARRLPDTALRGDHLHGKRDAVYRSIVGPGPGHPRVFSAPDGDLVDDGAENVWLYGLNAMTPGGGTRLWQGMAWRFLPEDFRMASEYGVPDASSLADWPVSYDEMEPFYARAEQELGVAGQEGVLTARTRRSSGYPLPPFEGNRVRDVLGSAADALGWGWGPIPLALNSVPYDGRPACVRCPQCIGHACPVDAKNGAHNTFLPRAVATGGCDVLYDAEVVEVRDGAGSASVTVMVGASSDAPTERMLSADVVVVAAGAVETARLLLASGLGNDHVGRHLHDHRVAMVLAEHDEPVKPYGGPGHSIATLDHVHSASIPWGGGVLVDLMNLMPHTFAGTPQPGRPDWGIEHKRWMRERRDHVFGVFGMGQEVPMPTSRVTLAAVRDRWGRPGAALRKDAHPASFEVDAGMGDRAEQWLTAAGGTAIRRQPLGAVAAGEHSCGTMRMSASERTGATDPAGRVWGTRRVVVCDQSLHVTNGSVNPTLTSTANAFRVAEHLVDAWR